MLNRNWCGTGMLVLLIAGLGSALQTQTAPTPRSVQQSPTREHGKTSAKAKPTGKKWKTKKPAVEVPPPPPAPPPTPEQMPAQPPEVGYSRGQLTINADNSTMNDVLAAVRRVTGATIEKPPIGGNDRVAVHLGPGDPKDVLTALFNGSRYDYIILGPMGQPGGVQRIILTARSNAPSQPVTSNAAMQARPNVAPPTPAAEQEGPDNAETEDMTVPEQNAPEAEEPQQEQPPPPQGYPQPGAPGQPQMQNPQGQEEQGQEPQQPRVKSPEELLRELQQMQKQQQNQQPPQ